MNGGAKWALIYSAVDLNPVEVLLGAVCSLKMVTSCDGVRYVTSQSSASWPRWFPQREL